MPPFSWLRCLRSAHGIETWLVRCEESDRLAVAKLCREPNTPGWFRLLESAHLLQRLDSLRWSPEKSFGVGGLQQLWQAPTLLVCLLDFIPGKPWPAWQGTFRGLLQLVLSLARLLERVHQQGIIHGDLAPNNVMVVDQAAPVLLDFGHLAVNPAESVSTLRYAAPELRGEIPGGAGPGWRAQLVGARLESGALPDGGYEMKLTLPLPGKSQADLP